MMLGCIRICQNLYLVGGRAVLHNKIVHNKEQATEMGIFNGDGIQLEVGTEFYRK